MVDQVTLLVWDQRITLEQRDNSESLLSRRLFELIEKEQQIQEDELLLSHLMFLERVDVLS